MIELTTALYESIAKYHDRFGEIVPLRRMPTGVTTEKIMEAIRKSFDEGKNLLPELLEYKS